MDAPRELRRQRVTERNDAKHNDAKQGTYAMEVPLPFFELASDMWEAPDETEMRTRKITRQTTG